MKVCIGQDIDGTPIYRDVVGDLDIRSECENKNNDTRTDRKRENSANVGSGEASGKDS